MNNRQPRTDGGSTPDDAIERTPPAVVVVDAQTPGNVGTIARSMKNFGFSELLLVDPPPIEPGDEAYGFAGHAREDVLPNATTVTFEELTERFHTFGCTAITGQDSRRHVRFPFKTPTEVRETLLRTESRSALVFGREGKGLSNAELARLDEVCSIPANPEYPVLNLGQAATILLYELSDLTLQESQLPPIETERADEQLLERLYEHVSAFLDAQGYNDRKRSKTERLFRRLFGRSEPTGREVKTLMGVFRRGTRQLEHRRELLERYDEPDTVSTQTEP